jgi:hypothetical protein
MPGTRREAAQPSYDASDGRDPHRGRQKVAVWGSVITDTSRARDCGKNAPGENTRELTRSHGLGAKKAHDEKNACRSCQIEVMCSRDSHGQIGFGIDRGFVIEGRGRGHESSDRGPLTYRLSVRVKWLGLGLWGRTHHKKGDRRANRSFTHPPCGFHASRKAGLRSRRWPFEALSPDTGEVAAHCRNRWAQKRPM